MEMGWVYLGESEAAESSGLQTLHVETILPRREPRSSLNPPFPSYPFLPCTELQPGAMSECETLFPGKPLRPSPFD